MKIVETRKEQAKLAYQDRRVIDRLSDELRSFHWVRIRGGCLKDISFTPEGKIAGLRRGY